MHSSYHGNDVLRVETLKGYLKGIWNWARRASGTPNHGGGKTSPVKVGERQSQGTRFSLGDRVYLNVRARAYEMLVQAITARRIRCQSKLGPSSPSSVDIARDYVAVAAPSSPFPPDALAVSLDRPPVRRSGTAEPEVCSKVSEAVVVAGTRCSFQPPDALGPVQQSHEQDVSGREAFSQQVRIALRREHGTVSAKLAPGDFR